MKSAPNDSVGDLNPYLPYRKIHPRPELAIRKKPLSIVSAFRKESEMDKYPMCLKKTKKSKWATTEDCIARAGPTTSLPGKWKYRGTFALNKGAETLPL
jgi:hypothetical protein